MGIRWNDYRNRRALLDLSKCFESWGVKTYDEFCNYLLEIGVIPPVTPDDDIVNVLKRNETEVREKPDSGRKSENNTVNLEASGDSKPTSGRQSSKDAQPVKKKTRKKVAKKTTSSPRKKSTRRISSKVSKK